MAADFERKPGNSLIAPMAYGQPQAGAVPGKQTLISQLAMNGPQKAAPASAAPAPTAGGGSRLTPLPPQWDLGEQIIDSGRIFTMYPPWNLGSVPADVTAQTDNPAFQVDDYPATLFAANSQMPQNQHDYQDAHPLTIRFNPRKSGSYSGTLTLAVKWEDGHSENVTVQLRGHARALDEIPAANKPAPSPDDDAVATVNAAEDSARKAHDKREPSNNAVEAFNIAAGTANKKAAMIADHQRNGMMEVERSVRAYQKAPPEHSILRELAEAAIMVGVGSVAGFAAGAVAGALANAIEEGTEASMTAEQAVTAIAEGSEVRKNPVIQGVQAVVKSGLEKAGKAAVAEAMSQGGTGVTTDGVTLDEFFGLQFESLTSAKDKNQDFVDTQQKSLYPMLATSPAVPIAAMTSIATSFDQTQQTAARPEQKSASMAKYLQMMARATLGSSTAKSADGSQQQEVTNLDNSRPRLSDGGLTSSAGLLDITLKLERGLPQVAEMRLNGVSKEFASALLDMENAKPLRSMHIPLRIVLAQGEAAPTLVTVDEAGRVRATGDYGMLSSHYGEKDDPASNEAQAHRGTQVLVDQILDRPLGSWGVGIMTDSKT